MRLAEVVSKLSARTVGTISEVLGECLPHIPENLPRPEGGHSTLAAPIQTLIPMLATLDYPQVVRIRFAVENAILGGVLDRDRDDDFDLVPVRHYPRCPR